MRKLKLLLAAVVTKRVPNYAVILFAAVGLWLPSRLAVANNLFVTDFDDLHRLRIHAERDSLHIRQWIERAKRAGVRQQRQSLRGRL